MFTNIFNKCIIKYINKSFKCICNVYYLNSGAKFQRSFEEGGEFNLPKIVFLTVQTITYH